MASLKDFRTDTRAINDGVWLRVGAEYGDLEIMTRGFSDSYVDAQEARLARAAIPYNSDQTKIPNAERRTINASLLEDFLVVDVRNLTDEKGEPVTVKDFHSMLYEPHYSQLARACWSVASKVSTLSKERLEQVVGNFGSSSVLP